MREEAAAAVRVGSKVGGRTHRTDTRTASAPTRQSAIREPFAEGGAYGAPGPSGLTCLRMTNPKLPRTTRSSEYGALIEDFRSFVAAQSFPCVGAKSALKRERIVFEVCDRLGSSGSAEVLRDRLARFSARHPDPGVDAISFVAIFREA